MVHDPLYGEILWNALCNIFCNKEIFDVSKGLFYALCMDKHA